MQEKKWITLGTLGHVDHGKSTTFGHLFCLMGLIDEHKIKAILDRAAEITTHCPGAHKRHEDRKYAYLLDLHKEEIERGLSITPHYIPFTHPELHYQYLLIDLPGHQDYINNMIMGAHVDIGILVIDVGDYKTAIARKKYEKGKYLIGGAYSHSLVSFCYKVKKMLVVINKMDKKNYEKSSFEEAKKEIKDTLLKIGFSEDKIDFLPLSAFHGDNLFKDKGHLSWWDGPTLFEAIKSLKPFTQPVDLPFRLSVHKTLHISGLGLVALGKVFTGALTLNSEIQFYPSGVKGVVKSLRIGKQRYGGVWDIGNTAEAGMITAFNLKVKSDKKIKPREVAFYPTQEHPKIALGFTGKTMLLTYPTTREMFTAHIGKSKFLIHLGADRRQCSIKKIRRLDGSECKDMRMGELYLVDFKVNPPGIVMDTFRELNHFIITEQGLVIGGGTVEKITEVKKLSE